MAAAMVSVELVAVVAELDVTVAVETVLDVTVAVETVGPASRPSWNQTE